MTPQNNTELQELKGFIGDRFNELDKKIDRNYYELDKKIDSRTNELEKKVDKTFSSLEKEISTIKVDVGWIKWLFGGLLSAILVLLSIILTVLFKLVN